MRLLISWISSMADWFQVVIVFLLLGNYWCVFTALHALHAMRSSDEKTVCLSVRVCPSVCQADERVDCDKTEERPVHIFYTIRKIL